MEPPWRAGTDVLIVDDSEAIRTSMKAILSSAGYRVSEAEDGFAALEQLRRGPVGVMVLGLHMPILDGYGLLDRLDDPPPVLVLTANGYDSKLAERRAKIFDFVQKPVHADHLIALIARALAQSPAEEAEPA